MKKIFTLLFLLLSFTIFSKENSLKDIQLKDINNKTVTLNKYKGKKVYLKMWASWCPVCLAGLQELDNLSGDKSKNFEVITVVSPNFRGEKSTEKFIQWYKGLKYKNVVVLLDEKGEIVKRAKVKGYPANVILNKNLEIEKTIFGHMNMDKIKGELK